MNIVRKIRVLVVDDSALVRRAISDALSADPELEVVGTACDPYVARDKIKVLQPDVLTLDMEMPRMDGLTFLRILRERHPMPVVVVSSVTPAGSKLAMEALEAGAVEVLAKPQSAYDLGEIRGQLARSVKAAARASSSNLRRPVLQAPPRVIASTAAFNANQLVVIGASTGGTEAIKQVLRQLPENMPGICIVQHIPAVFSRAFADRLNELCAMEVREAVQGDEVRPGLALIAPGDFHMTVTPNGGRYRVNLNQGPPLHHTRPAVDVLFNSAAACAGRHAVGVILTGMGGDGAQGMRKLKEAGAATMVQDEATCVVYGMPQAAVALGVVDRVLPLEKISEAIMAELQPGTATAAGIRKPPSVTVPTNTY